MNIKLTSIEARVIAVLIEKEITTPDQYPLSLNALTNGCNQKSNREPVMNLSESTVQTTVDALIKRYLVSNHSGYGSRVSKFRHRFCNTEFGQLKLSPRQLAVICELLLRGPQTPGELRGRADRLSRFNDVEEVENVLAELMSRETPMVVRLPREPGRRENRYAHLLGEEIPISAEEAGELPPVHVHRTPASERIDELELQVQQLRGEVDELKRKWAEFVGN